MAKKKDPNKPPPPPRTMFLKTPSKGDDGQAERLFNKYKKHLAKDFNVDLEEDMDDLADSYEEYGLGRGDYNWVRMHHRLKHSFKYPSQAVLFQCFKDYHLEVKSKKLSSEDDEAKMRKIWDAIFIAAAVDYDRANEGKEYGELYLRKKMAKLLKLASAKAGKPIENPIKVGSSRISAEAVINADKLDWL